MLEILTEKQKKIMSQVRDKWLDMAFDCKPIDKKKAIKSINWLYNFCGYQKPKIIGCESPMQAQIIANNMIKSGVGDTVGDNVLKNVWDNVRDTVRDNVLKNVWDNVRDTVRDTVWDNVGGATVWANVRDTVGDNVGGDTVGDTVGATVRDNVGANVGATVWANVGATVRATVWDNVRDTVRDTVGDTVWDTVGDTVGATVRDTVGDTVWDTVGDTVGATVRDNVGGDNEFFKFSKYGNFSDYGWCSFYDFFYELHLDFLERNKKLKSDFLNFKNILDSGIYNTIQFEKLCIICAKPKLIKKEIINNIWRLHCIDGAAIKWRDGYEQYYIHGIYFDKELFDKKDFLNFQNIMDLKNEEQKQALIAYLGEEKLFYLLDTRPKLIDKSERGNELYEITGIYDQPEKMLRYKDTSTNRIYYKWVEPHYNNADQAQAESHGFTFKEYQQLTIES